jgi:hypothetical protein
MEGLDDTSPPAFFSKKNFVKGHCMGENVTMKKVYIKM